MKRFLSWLTLIPSTILVILFTIISKSILGLIFGLLDGVGPIIRIIVYLIGGTATIGLAIAPIWYGSIITVAWSNYVSNSKRGTRFLVYGIILAILYVSDMLLFSGFTYNKTIMTLYSAALIFMGVASRK